jgi:hypothetical protein
VDSGDTTAAANLFSRKIDTWMENLHLYAKKAVQKEGCRTDCEAQTQKSHLQSCFKNFGSDPEIEKLDSLRGALKELYALKYTESVSVLIVEFKELNLKYYTCDTYI